jgi:zinc and cadmium transporter
MTAILFFGVLFTGLLTELVSTKLEKYKQSIISFSVAIVLTLICSHILPEIFSMHNHRIGYFLLIGFILQILLELLSKGIEHGHVHIHGKISNKELFVIFIGLSIHSFIEGIPVNTLQDLNHNHVSSFDSFSWVYLTAILIHKLPIAAVLIIFLNSINSSFKRKIIFLLLFAISSPSGAFFGEYIVESSFFSQWSNNFLAISTGMLLHITTLLIFEDHHGSSGKFKNLLTIFGGIITGILIFSF